jgi:hypothetical protein
VDERMILTHRPYNKFPYVANYYIVYQ